MALAESALNIGADAIGDAITHIGLVDGSGNEIAGGAYARLPVAWTAPAGGIVRPTTDLEFSVPAGATVAGWRGFTALAGGTNHGGESLTPETFAGAGTYVLEAAGTGIDLNAV